MNNKLVDLYKKIKEKKIENVYFFYGNEEYLLNIYLNKLKKILLNNIKDDFNYLELKKNVEINSNRIIDFIFTMPLFEQVKLLFIYEDFILESFIIEKLKNIPKNVYIIFISKNKNKFNILINKKIINNKNIFAFNELSSNDLYYWVNKKFIDANITIDKDVYKYFIFCCQKSMYNLENEISKLILYMTHNKIRDLNFNIINNICNKIKNAKIFEIIDPIINCNYYLTFNIIEELIILKYDYSDIFYVILNYFQKLYIIKYNSEKCNDKLMELINTKSLYYLNNIINNSNKISSLTIANILNFILLKEKSLKNTNNKKNLLENVIFIIIEYLTK